MKVIKLNKIVIDIFLIVGMLTGLFSGFMGTSQAIAAEPQKNTTPPTTTPVDESAPSSAEISITPVAIDSTQTSQLETVPLTITNEGDADLTWTLYDGTSAGWSDNFDSYETGSQMHGQGGWKGWFNSPAAGALTTDVQSISPPNSVDIVDTSDLVHEYSGYTSGQWTYTAWQYIPSSMTGQTYFIMLNQYDDAGINLNWSVQVYFDALAGQVFNTGISGGILPLITNAWVELRVEIDLTNDITRFYYDNQLLYQGTWTDEVSGGGIKNIGAVDLFANFASDAYYDDISLLPTNPPECGVWGDIPWLSTDPADGTTGAGLSSPVDVLLDATGMALGTYTAELCAASNDPTDPLLSIPVEMNVVASADLEIAKADTPDPVFTGAPITYTLTITNNGPDGATGVTVGDLLPAGVTFVSASEGCTEAAGVVTCDVGDLAVDAAVIIEIVVTAPAEAGLITNQAAVAGNELDLDLTNNLATQETTVKSQFVYTFLPIAVK